MPSSSCRRRAAADAVASSGRGWPQQEFDHSPPEWSLAAALEQPAAVPVGHQDREGAVPEPLPVRLELRRRAHRPVRRIDEDHALRRLARNFWDHPVPLRRAVAGPRSSGRYGDRSGSSIRRDAKL
jgi:hypothetical protein